MKEEIFLIKRKNCGILTAKQGNVTSVQGVKERCMDITG